MLTAKFEYDAISDRYSEFLIEEILANVGKLYNLSKDPNDRAIGGAGSGGTAALTAAWFRPDVFRRVLIFGGSDGGYRGDDVYPTLIRKSETRPLRVFLQNVKCDTSDPFAEGGNRDSDTPMAAAFKDLGYDCRFDPVKEDHGDANDAAVLPDALRWLWHGHPQPIVGARRDAAADIVVPGKGWEPFGEKIDRAFALAADRQGNLFVSESRYMQERILKFDVAGKSVVFKDYRYDPPEHSRRGHQRAGIVHISPMTVGQNGTLYAYRDHLEQIVAFAPDGKETVVARDVERVEGLAGDRHGSLYFADAGAWNIRLVDPGKPPRVVAAVRQSPYNLQLMPGGSRLVLGNVGWGPAWSYQVMPGGQLTDGKPFCQLAAPAVRMDAMAADSAGRLYVGTEVGIQVFDVQGRLVLIMAAPPGGNLWYMAVGGPDFQTLYANAGYKLFCRPLKTKGIRP